MKIFLVTEKNNCSPFAFRTMIQAAGFIGRSVQTLRNAFHVKGYYENKDFIITKSQL